jgi:hypothetical protein
MMAWSEKAIEAAYLKLVGALDENMMEHHLQDVCQLIIAALDAAAAVDGDAGWQIAAQAARIYAFKESIELMDDLRHVPTKGTWDGHFRSALEQKIEESRDAIRSLKRLK